jgi:hypothetical protein
VFSETLPVGCVVFSFSIRGVYLRAHLPHASIGERKDLMSTQSARSRRQRRILEQLEKHESPIGAKRLAKLAGYQYNSSFRQELANLKRFEQIWNLPEGWALLPGRQMALTNVRGDP